MFKSIKTAAAVLVEMLSFSLACNLLAPRPVASPTPVVEVESFPAETGTEPASVSKMIYAAAGRPTRTAKSAPSPAVG
jgi:hypothetical protein